MDLPIERAIEFFESIPLRGVAGAAGTDAGGLDPDIAGPILKEVVDRLRFLRDVGLDYLTLGRARHVALRRRDPADQAGHPDRLAAGRGALHPRRAEHRAAPAGQRAAARHAARAAGPGEHGHRGRARRGHHPGGRPRDRSGTPGRPLRRRGRGRGNGRGHPQPPRVADRRYLRDDLRIPVPRRPARGSGPASAPHRRAPGRTT